MCHNFHEISNLPIFNQYVDAATENWTLQNSIFMMKSLFLFTLTHLSAYEAHNFIIRNNIEYINDE